MCMKIKWMCVCIQSTCILTIFHWMCNILFILCSMNNNFCTPKLLIEQCNGSVSFLFFENLMNSSLMFTHFTKRIHIYTFNFHTIFTNHITPYERFHFLHRLLFLFLYQCCYAINDISDYFMLVFSNSCKTVYYVQELN